MKSAFVDMHKKPTFFGNKPQIYKFDTGSELYVFPGKCQTKRLEKALKKHDVQVITDKCSEEFKADVYCRTIMQVIKTKNIHEVVFCTEKTPENINILTYFFNHDISFSITHSDDSEEIADFFLEKYGLPITITNNVKSGLIVYTGGPLPRFDSSVNLLDLSGKLNSNKICVSEYLIKNFDFPVRILSLPVLQTALTLTGKDIKDIIIKLCIIRTKCE